MTDTMRDYCGIGAYSCECDPVSGLLKKRFTDFIVREITPAGDILRLDSLEVADNIASVSGKALFEPMEKSVREEGLKGLLDEGDMEKVFEFAERREAEYYALKEKNEKVEVPWQEVENKDYILLEKIEDKDRRRNVHQAVKKVLPLFLSDTQDGRVRLRFFPPEFVAAASRNQGGKKGKGGRPNKRNQKEADISFDPRGKDAWPAGKGEYLHFTLCKENRDTTEAVNVLSRFLHVKPSSIAWAGTKDKRGVTSQRMSVFKVEAERVADLNKRLIGMRVGGYSYEKEALKLGDLWGNHFEIVIRGIDDEEKAKTAAKRLGASGLFNFFGHQRFGSPSAPTHRIGCAILKEEYEAAINLILARREGEGSEADEARKSYFEGEDLRLVLQKFPKYMSIERSIIISLSKHGRKAYANALDSLPRNLRLMYVHSYQSYVWNSVVSERIKRGVLSPIEGDLVVSNDKVDDGIEVGDDEGEVLEMDKMRAADRKSVEEEIAEMVTVGSKNGVKDSAKHVKKEEVEKVVMKDVVLPLPGHDIHYPENWQKDVYAEILKADGLTFESFKHKVKTYSLPGGYRKVHFSLKDYSYEVVDVPDLAEDVLQSDLDKMGMKKRKFEKTEEPVPGKGLVLRVSLPSSSYATVFLREILRENFWAALEKPSYGKKR